MWATPHCQPIHDEWASNPVVASGPCRQSHGTAIYCLLEENCGDVPAGLLESPDFSKYSTTGTAVLPHDHNVPYTVGFDDDLVSIESSG